MAEIKDDDHHIANTRNLSRYFVENRAVAWVLLIVILASGAYSYIAMEKRKDPLYSNLYAVTVCAWPGASADKVEQLITKKIEEKVSENMKVVEIKSVSRSNVSIITMKLDDRIGDTALQFDDLSGRVSSITDLPSGAGPIIFLKDYGDVATLMLTVASPPADDVDVSLRADQLKRAISQGRLRAPSAKLAGTGRTSVIVCYPRSVESAIPRRGRDLLMQYGASQGVLSDAIALDGSGFVGFDAVCSLDDDKLNRFIDKFVRERLRPSQLHPDLWMPVIIHDVAQCKAKLLAVSGDKYSYRELDQFTDLIERSLHTLPEVSRITRHGNLGEQINLDFSQERLASYRIQPLDLREKLENRNILPSGGILEVVGKNLPIRPTGEFKDEKDIGGVLVATSQSGAPIYLRDLVDISRDYESPSRFLGFLNWKDKGGQWHRTRGVTLAIFMRTEEHIDKFAQSVNACLDSVRRRLPGDLVFVRTSDQPVQVKDNIGLFMMSLLEAIALVVLTALIGFWEWRSALVIALSIPTTLAMTFGMMHLLGLDIQQCSVAALIISLGLLVDDPVVAGDAIKRTLAEGSPPLIAAWLGPTKLAHAILFATITNIAAYLPLLMMSGEIGQFIFSLPIVITCSLIASRIVSMTFVPLLGYYLLRPGKKPQDLNHPTTRSPVVETYLKAGSWVIANRLIVFAASIVLLVSGFCLMSKIKTSFFPNDLFNVCWVDVWLPEDAPLVATNDAAIKVENIIRQVTDKYEKDNPHREGNSSSVLKAITTFVGGSGPRFWSTIMQELDQLNYAQVIIQVGDKHDTDKIIPILQKALTSGVPEARCDVRFLEGGKPVGVPVSLRISGADQSVLRQLASKVTTILLACPLTSRVRDDWGSGSFAVKMDIDSDRAYLAGLTNADVAASSVISQSGYKIDTMRDGDKQIPIVIRMRAEEGSQVEGLADLYVYSTASQQKVPLSALASLKYGFETEKIRRRNQFRTITVGSFTAPGVLPSEVMEQIRPQLNQIEKTLPPGYKMEVGGEEEEQVKSFDEMTVVMSTSVICIFLCLLFQFKSAVKPLIVFAGIPYGILGALVGLEIMNQPFGFPAFLGVASLAGVIVSHIIVLFDFIESSREEGAPLQEALLHASMVRLRPVLITVSATVLGFIPLAMHGGPLWEPLCYAQIGGLIFATFVTLIIVPVIYAITVLDLKIVRWGPDLDVPIEAARES